MSTSLPNENAAPAYLIGQAEIKVSRGEYFARYARPAVELLQRYGAEVLVATPAPQVMEGTWTGNWTVVIRFPSMATAREFYAAQTYAPLKARRLELCSFGNLVFAEAFDSEALGF